MSRDFSEDAMPTEGVDPRFVDLDLWPTEVAVEAMIESQMAAIAAVRSQARAIASAADAAAMRLLTGGRLIYAGAGTSGRVAVQDGVELGPTFGWPEAQLGFLLAGGRDALFRSAEGAEDDAAGARTEVAQLHVDGTDVLIGVAASGRTPYTLAAVEAAREAGALTIAIASNPAAPLLASSDHPVLVETGSEVVAGSTRMKAGTAQKVVLNSLSTAIMLRCGLVYRGLMVNMRVSNEKLERRAIGMVGQLATVSADVAAAALAKAQGDIRKAVLVARGMDIDAAEAALHRAGLNLRAALATEGGEHA